MMWNSGKLEPDTGQMGWGRSEGADMPDDVIPLLFLISAFKLLGFERL